jgi:hypothetical protein
MIVIALSYISRASMSRQYTLANMYNLVMPCRINVVAAQLGATDFSLQTINSVIELEHVWILGTASSLLA